MAEALPGRFLIGADEIQRSVAAVATQILGASPKPEVMVPILNGAMLFASDLLRALQDQGVSLELGPIRVKRGQNNKPDILMGNNSTALCMYNHKHVLVVDTIHDQGPTARLVLNHIMRHGNAKSVSFACFMARDTDLLPVNYPNYVGCDMRKATDWYYGYGMDLNGAFRGLRTIHALTQCPEVPERILAPQA